MTMTAFDTLAYARKLKDAGVQDSIAEAQSEATAEIFHALIVERLATKDDLNKLEIALKDDLKDIKSDLEKIILSSEKNILSLELRLLLKFGGMMAAAIGILFVLLKYHT